MWVNFVISYGETFYMPDMQNWLISRLGYLAFLAKRGTFFLGLSCNFSQNLFNEVICCSVARWILNGMHLIFRRSDISPRQLRVASLGAGMVSRLLRETKVTRLVHLSRGNIRIYYGAI